MPQSNITSLLIASGYSHTQVGLFAQNQLIDYCSDHNTQASSSLLLQIDRLFNSHSLSLNHISYIGIHQGPAPFTSLRVALAYANGIAFARDLPVVGVNGIATLALKSHDPSFHTTIVIHNAYAEDVYYAIYQTGHKVTFGCMKFTRMIEHITSLESPSIRVLGNAVILSKEILHQALKSHTHITLVPNQAHDLSLDLLGQQAHEQWIKRDNVASHMLPLYLKPSVANRNA